MGLSSSTVELVAVNVGQLHCAVYDELVIFWII